MCIAFQAEATSVVSMVGYLAIVYSLATDLFFFGESLSTVEFLGCGFVICITLLMGVYRMRKSTPAVKQQTTSDIESVVPIKGGLEERLLGKQESVHNMAHETSSYLSQYNEFASQSFMSRERSLRQRQQALNQLWGISKSNKDTELKKVQYR